MENKTVYTEKAESKGNLKQVNDNKKEEIKNSRFNLSFPIFKKNSGKSITPVMNGNSLFNADHSFFQEPVFQELLILERKRSERSQKQFLLVLIDIQRLALAERTNGTGKKLVRMLKYISRETDIKGWYEENRIIGIIYTGISYIDIQSLLEKVKIEIKTTLNREQAAAISLSHILFPQKSNKEETDQLQNNKILYNNVPKKHFARQAFMVAKRYIDIFGSISLIVLFSPFMAVIPVLIKLTSKGPVFFRQERIGCTGKKFTLLKFRSMTVNNDSSSHLAFMKNFINGTGDTSNDGIYKMKDDRRVTKIGRLLRKSSLDELPQFFNVLKGDMSLVGPRPALPYEVEHYNIWHKRRVLEVKPGITGMWQVMGRSKTTFEEMVRMDIRYIKSWSPLQDLLLILRTPFAVLLTKGAY